MSTETSFQIRHKELGIFVGEMMGMGFWTAISDMPEQGYCEFPTFEGAVAYIDRASRCENPLRPEDMAIEPYDRATSERLIAEWSGRNGRPAGEA